MGFTTFVAGNVALASEANNYLMKQTVMVFTNASDRTTQLTGVTLTEGMVSFLQDISQVQIHDGTNWIPFGSVQAWTGWTPTVGGTLTLGTGGTAAYTYIQIGKVVLYRIRIVLGTGGTLSALTFTLPVTAAATHADNDVIGVIRSYDSSATSSWSGLAIIASGLIAPRSVTSTTSNLLAALSATVPFGAAWASGDILTITGSYEAA